MKSSPSPAVLRDASTVLLLRDGIEGLEVFMVVRHQKIEFASGALVFPGGAVDETDGALALRDRVSPSAQSLTHRELCWRVAAIREVYEESGVLLASRRGESTLVDSKHLLDINQRHESTRRAHRLEMPGFAETEDLILACDRLVPFAHWITPESRPKRFDTRFYLARAPEDHEAVHDGHEATDSLWARPEAVCREGNEGRWLLRFPTRVTLEKLSRFASTDAALRGAEEMDVIPVESRLSKTGGVQRIHIPREAGYGFGEAVLDDNGNIVSRR